jgi:hypothetical protein
MPRISFKVIDLGRSLQYGGEHSAQGRAIAEYWELGFVCLLLQSFEVGTFASQFRQ